MCVWVFVCGRVVCRVSCIAVFRERDREKGQGFMLSGAGLGFRVQGGFADFLKDRIFQGSFLVWVVGVGVWRWGGGVGFQGRGPGFGV